MTTTTGAPTTTPVRYAVRARPSVAPDLAGAAAAFSLLVVVALWVGNRGVQELTGGGGPALTSAGRLTGLLSADLLLLQVALIARIPFVERAFGQDRLAGWHRWVGFTSFHLLLAHIVLVTVGYAATVHTGVIGQFWDLVTTYPGMLLATAAFALFVLVVVTSVRAARRRLRYESWHLLHLYAYLGVGLALPHQLWTGGDFVSSPLARAYWWTLYLLVAGSVLVFRLGLPAYRSLRHDLRVTAVVPEGPGVVSIYLRGRAMHRLPARAGQFFLWRFRAGPGWSRAHPYSLSAPPAGDQLRITVKDLGDGSRATAALRPGTRVLIEGPYGRLTGEHYRGGGLTMLASGIGVTPLLALLGELPYAPGSATLVYRAHSGPDLVMRQEIEALAARRGIRLAYLVGPRAPRASWLPASLAAREDAEVLREIAPGIVAHDVYICGPGPWMAAARAAAAAAGVPERHIHVEQFNW